jgi:hypothetical protein
MSKSASTKKDITRAATALASAKSNNTSKGAADYITGYEDLVDNAVQRHFVANQAKAVYEAIDAEVIAVAEGFYAENARNGKFVKSVNLAGDKFEGLNVSFQDSFSSIPVESKEAIINAYIKSGMTENEAHKAFEENFEEGRSVKMKDTSDETISVLSTLLRFAQILVMNENAFEKEEIKKLRSDLRGSVSRGGRIVFGEIFTSDVVLVTKKGMDMRQFSQPEEVRDLLKQKKAATKVKVGIATVEDADEALRKVTEIILETTNS